MKKIALLFTLLFALLSCETNHPTVNNQTSLNGKWNWVSSSGGFTGKMITPESEKKTMTIEISDSVIKKYQDGKLLSKNSFSIQPQQSIFGGERKMIILDNDMPKQSFEIKDNKLYLSEECNDCYQSEYVRIK